MTAQETRAHVEYDPLAREVGIVLVDRDAVLVWGRPDRVMLAERDPGQPIADPPLAMPEHVARALYDALADHFGHAGHDARALRRDYDHERGRVDRMLAALLEGRP